MFGKYVHLGMGKDIDIKFACMFSGITEHIIKPTTAENTYWFKISGCRTE